MSGGTPVLHPEYISKEVLPYRKSFAYGSGYRGRVEYNEQGTWKLTINEDPTVVVVTALSLALWPVLLSSADNINAYDYSASKPLMFLLSVFSTSKLLLSQYAITPLKTFGGQVASNALVPYGQNIGTPVVVFDLTKQIMRSTIERFSVAFNMQQTRYWLIHQAGMKVAGLINPVDITAFQSSLQRVINPKPAIFPSPSIGAPSPSTPAPTPLPPTPKPSFEIPQGVKNAATGFAGAAASAGYTIGKDFLSGTASVSIALGLAALSAVVILSQSGRKRKSSD